ncbi:uroporphyrinogen-III C-methyltransferase [Desulfobotulus sp. H1]|uniref:uroporphyrinogen-III C-methyltransferase n=1 Tax=Desulfobotulus pelophilus TaxID=2823377 RepID=A0ABT3N4V4_9BACT|nr:uroporphyrinogen-III C-methyltransferase [Desulfobotulus pelophilus]MCW7752474.1 uroporphyrinogen-III C-methyltransferase [Desulfobotulus pelophilus]
MKPGKVFLVGAGPGDPGLFTLKGKECMAQAGVIIYDYLAAPPLLALASPEAECIYVGKKGGDHTLSQDAINQLIVDKARTGRTVVRLKGGDPFIFGRGGEEAEVLKENGIPFEVVPGVTAGIAASAYAGIPLTHRKMTATLAFVTGHEDPAKEDSNINWEALSRGIGTIVFYMGVKNLPLITARLLQHGRDPMTPVALIRWGSTTRQQTLTGNLTDIEEKVRMAGLKAPAIIVVGDVVQLRNNLAWFEKERPLLGKRILVTRAREQASDLVHQLTQLGACCIEIPTIRVEKPKDLSAMDAAIDTLDHYDWLIFTSVNGVRHFFHRLFEKGLDVRALHRVKTACIGPVTAERLLDFGIRCDILPQSYRAESVADAFMGVPMKGQNVLLPRAEEARSVLPDALREMGANVDEVTAYVTLPVTDQADALTSILEKGDADFVTFTSSSTVKNFTSLIPANRFEELTRHLKVASIGPITSDTAIKLGFTVDIEAKEFTIPGLVGALCGEFSHT